MYNIYSLIYNWRESRIVVCVFAHQDSFELSELNPRYNRITVHYSQQAQLWDGPSLIKLIQDRRLLNEGKLTTASPCGEGQQKHYCAANAVLGCEYSPVYVDNSAPEQRGHSLALTAANGCQR
ncbi:hypothetical protein BsWGS_20379 [Bradybaena similaris]